VLHHINRHFRFLWDSAMYATALYAVVDASARTLRVASAGHPLPLHVRRGERAQPIPLETVMCLLWSELGDVPCLEHALGAGDRVAFYTDGITDRIGPKGAMYDVDRLIAVLDEHGHRCATDIAQQIVADLEAFAKGHEPDDDQTLLIVGID
jgi:serine phosphatase RsbU (regulator of sigma subunit)